MDEGDTCGRFLFTADEIQQRQFAVIEDDMVNILKNAGIGEMAPFGRRIAAAENNGNGGALLFKHLCHAESGIDRAGKRERKANKSGTMLSGQLKSDVIDLTIDQVLGGFERGFEWVERGRGNGEAFAIAGEVEFRRKIFADHVGEIFQHQTGEIAGAILDAERSEGRQEGILIGIFEPGKSGAFRQEIRVDDAIGERRVVSAKKLEERGDDGLVAGCLGQEGSTRQLEFCRAEG